VIPSLTRANLSALEMSTAHIIRRYTNVLFTSRELVGWWWWWWWSRADDKQTAWYEHATINCEKTAQCGPQSSQ